MELYAFNLQNDLIFLISDYIQNQAKMILRENYSNDDQIREFLREHSIVGIVPQAGPIIVEVVNDPDNINSILFLFLWHQIIIKTQDLPNYDTEQIKLLNLGGN